MVMVQCTKCKNSNPQCRENFVLYFSAVNMATQLANNANENSRFFKEKENQRHYTFEVKCSHFEPKEEGGRSWET